MAFILSALWWIRIRGFWKLPDGRGRAGYGESGSCSDGQGHAHEIFNPIFCWWVGLCFLPAASLRPNSDRGYSSLLQKYLYQDCCSHYPWPHGRSLQAHTSTGDSWTFIGKPGSVSCGVTAPFPRSWCAQSLVCALQDSCFPSPMEVLQSNPTCL